MDFIMPISVDTVQTDLYITVDNYIYKYINNRFETQNIQLFFILNDTELKIGEYKFYTDKNTNIFFSIIIPNTKEIWKILKSSNIKELFKVIEDNSKLFVFLSFNPEMSLEFQKKDFNYTENIKFFNGTYRYPNFFNNILKRKESLKNKLFEEYLLFE